MRRFQNVHGGKNGVVCGGYVETVAVSGIKVSFLAYFLSEGHVTHASAAVVGQLMAERSVFLLFAGELGNDHCAALLTVEAKERFKYF
jgi:hypothetical protein